MSVSHSILVAVVAVLPLAATAQQSRPADPANANATVSATGYVSAFANYRATPAENATPDQLWRAANEEITSQDMHGGHMGMPGMGPAKTETKADTPKANTPTADPHAGHRNMQGK